MEFLLILFVCGYLGQLFANLILLVKIRKTKSVYGLCEDTQQVFWLSTVSRVIWMYDTRLTSMYLASFEVFTNVILMTYIVYLCYKMRETRKFDTPKYFKAPILTAVCLVLCFMFHPGSKNEYYLTVQMLVSFSMFMECVGLLPQFIVMRKAQEVEGLTSHYIMCLGAARFLRLMFWLWSYWEGDMFGYLIIADGLHAILLGDFAFYYFRSIRSGKSILLV